MSAKKKEPKKKTDLQKYLSKPLPPFRRGDADCGAWVGAWINQVVGKELLTFKPMTFGAISRRHQETPVREYAANLLKDAGFEKVASPSSGSVVIYRHDDSYDQTAVGIWHEGRAITRAEGDKLHITEEPEIIESWKFSRNSC